MTLPPINRRKFVGVSAASSLSVAVARFPLPSFSNDTGIRIAIIGMGDRGQRHFHRLAQRKDVQISALCDIDERASLHVLRNHHAIAGKAPSLYRSVEDLIPGKSVDAAVVALPAALRPDLVRRLTLAGMPVLVEPPLYSIYREPFAATSPMGKAFVQVAEPGRCNVLETSLASSAGIADAVHIELITVVSPRAAARKTGTPQSMRFQSQDPLLLPIMRDECAKPLLHAWRLLGRATPVSVHAVSGASYAHAARACDGRVSYGLVAKDATQKRLEVQLTTIIDPRTRGESVNQPAQQTARLTVLGRNGCCRSEEVTLDQHIADRDSAGWEHVYSRFITAVRRDPDENFLQEIRDDIATGELLRVGRLALARL